MSEAVLSVTFAGPLVTFQDAGRFGQMRYGVAASGPMDRLAFDAAHAALGNRAGGTAIEISLGGLMLQCKSGEVTLAVTGGAFLVEHGAQKLQSWTILTLKKGERLAIRAGRAGSWAYLAFAGQPVVQDWLQSRATHSTSGFGGGALQAGQTITIADAATREDRPGDIPQPDFGSEGAVGVVVGPQDQHFESDAVARFLSEPYKVTDAYDRMGMRLNGPALALAGALSIPSEPIVRGSVQVSGDGVPTVLLADHQTTGGYPKIATVISSETDRLAQLRSGQVVRFTALSPEKAVTQARAYLDRKGKYLEEISVPRGTLEQRLMRENLISGWVHV